jgi:hypothetical protein
VSRGGSGSPHSATAGVPPAFRAKETLGMRE